MSFSQTFLKFVAALADGADAAVKKDTARVQAEAREADAQWSLPVDYDRDSEHTVVMKHWAQDSTD